jgi:hypothetical protein
MLPSPAIKISGNYLASTRLPVTASDRFTMILFFSFALVALVLAGVGIYGVMAFTVAQREHEIGLRMALGASRGNLVSLILNEALILSCCGFARCRIRPGPDRSFLRGPCLAPHSLRSRFHGLCRNRSRFRCPQSSFDRMFTSRT